MSSFEERTSFTVGEVTVTIVDRTEIRAFPHGQGFVVTARKEPIEVRVVENGVERTLARFDAEPS